MAFACSTCSEDVYGGRRCKCDCISCDGGDPYEEDPVFCANCEETTGHRQHFWCKRRCFYCATNLRIARGLKCWRPNGDSEDEGLKRFRESRGIDEKGNKICPPAQ